MKVFKKNIKNGKGNVAKRSVVVKKEKSNISYK